MSVYTFVDIPAGTVPVPCKGCRVLMYYVGRQPISCDVPESVSPTETMDGRGINHFISCPERERFRRKKK